MPAPAEIKKLVDKFAHNRDEYMASSYNEHQVRIEFINPLLKALGWDVDNSEGASERYREVVHEDRVMVGGESKAPDYSCRLGGNRVFFVEAKKPSVDLKSNPGPAFQLRRYAWSAKLPVSVLTDFEELVIYDTTAKPGPKDKPTVGRLRYWNSTEFVEKWDEITAILSKEAVRSGAFDKFAGERKRKAVAQVDEDFLEAIEEWRDLLARDLAKGNSDLDSAELSSAVQRILDRIVFLRICEDRGIEPAGQLHALVNGPHVYGRLKELFGRADKRYNSGLFHFREEKGRHESPDALTPKLEVGDKALKSVIDALYDDAPWAFGVIPADILGSIYEQFLGKVIHRDGRGVRIEEKPEVKKAGGVYYTPKYIVDYIVKETVGKLLEGKTPKAAAEIKVLDPACGSGSFLVGAYQYLLDWHLDQYLKTPERHKKELLEFPKGVWRITAAERKRILTNSIYGVDIDPQAVEVTKLSLLLKVLEGESAQSIKIAFDLMPERALPDLGDNVRRGNSLIGEDFLTALDSLQLPASEIDRISPFDLEKAFRVSGVSKGFSVVIGNPPYGALFTEAEKGYLGRAFPVIKGQPESYEYFMARTSQVLAPAGRVGMIVPTNFAESQRAEGLRSLLLEKGRFERIASFRYPVWKSNASETLVYTWREGKGAGPVLVSHPATPAALADDVSSSAMDQGEWRTTPGKRFLLRADRTLIAKIEQSTVRLSEVAEVRQGIIVYKTREEGRANKHIAFTKKGPSWKKLLDTHSQIAAYRMIWGGSWLNYGDWLWCPREPWVFESKKILFVRLRNKSLVRRLVGAIDEAGHYNRDNFNNIIAKDSRYSLEYLLALFNSRLLNFWYRSYFDNVNINPTQVGLLPIMRIDQVPKKVVAELEAAVQQLSKLGHSDPLSAVDERRMVALQKVVDARVYEMYGMRTAEIAQIDALYDSH